MADHERNGLISYLKREVEPDETRLKEFFVPGGIPEKAENLKCLGFNRHIIELDNRSEDHNTLNLFKADLPCRV